MAHRTRALPAEGDYNVSDMQLDGSIHLPARVIPAPKHLSAAARSMLAIQKSSHLSQHPTDTPGWRAYVAQSDAMIMQMLDKYPRMPVHTSRQRQLQGVTVYDIVPTPQAATKPGIVFDMHGGGLIMGGGAVGQRMSEMLALRIDWPVCAVDYRMPPDHPYPAALDDCVTVYRSLLNAYDAKDIVVNGISAGGNLAAALVLRLRDEGLPLPAAAMLLTPEVDLTESGDSFHTNADLDAVLSSIMHINVLYANGHDLAHPYLSPLFADFSLGFVPTLLTAGTRDLFLSNAVRMHRALRRANVHAELHLIEAASHTGFGGAPEAQDIDLEMRKFLDAHMGKASRTAVQDSIAACSAY